jgi:tetratricopeptide (TPR) repeat protein
MSTLDTLSALEIYGLIRQYQNEPDLAYLFRHALVQDAAYDSLLKSDRRTIHLLIGRIMEALYSERLDEVAPELARHFHEAGDHASAAKYYSHAGQRAFDTFANVEAAGYFRSAIELHPDKNSSTYADLNVSLGGVLYRLGRQVDSASVYLLSAQIYYDLSDFARCAMCYNLASRSYFFAGDFQKQYELAQKAYELLEEHPDTEELISTLRTLANASYFSGKSQEAIEYASKALEMLRTVDNIQLQGITLVTYGTVLPQNECTKKLKAMREAVEISCAHVPQSVSTSIFNYAETALILNGDWRLACEYFRDGIWRMKQANSLLAEFWQTSGLQKALTIAGQFEEADKLDERINELREMIPDHGTVEGALIVIKAVRDWYEGHTAQAITTLEKGLGEAIRNNDQQLINELGTWLAEICIDADRYDMAAEILPKAITAGDRNLMWGGIIPRCLLVATLIHDGQTESARQLLNEAHTLSQPDSGRMTKYALALASARMAAAENHKEEAIVFYEEASKIAGYMELAWHVQRTLKEMDKFRGNL